MYRVTGATPELAFVVRTHPQILMYSLRIRQHYMGDG